MDCSTSGGQSIGTSASALFCIINIQGWFPLGLTGLIFLLSKGLSRIFSVQFSSVTQSCPTLCDPIDCSMPGFDVHYQLLELAHTHVHRVGDAIQPFHPLSSTSPLTFNPKHQGLFSESVLRIRWPKYWSFSFSIKDWFPLGLTGLISLRLKSWDSQESSSAPQF